MAYGTSNSSAADIHFNFGNYANDIAYYIDGMSVSAWEGQHAAGMLGMGINVISSGGGGGPIDELAIEINDIALAINKDIAKEREKYRSQKMEDIAKNGGNYVSLTYDYNSSFEVGYLTKNPYYEYDDQRISYPDNLAYSDYVFNSYHGTENNYNEAASNWEESTQTGLGAFGMANGAKSEIINFASKADASINELGYVKAVRVAGKGVFALQVGISGYQAYSAFKNNDPNAWGVASKAGLDVTMGAIGIWGGPVGWVVSATYFIGDVAGWWGDWGKPTNP
jgi:hypothetical protein